MSDKQGIGHVSNDQQGHDPEQGSHAAADGRFRLWGWHIGKPPLLLSQNWLLLCLLTHPLSLPCCLLRLLLRLPCCLLRLLGGLLRLLGCALSGLLRLLLLLPGLHVFLLAQDCAAMPLIRVTLVAGSWAKDRSSVKRNANGSS